MNVPRLLPRPHWWMAFWLSVQWLIAVTAGAEVLVSNVEAVQKTGTKLVEIRYDLTGDSGPFTVKLRISSDDGATFAVPISNKSPSGAFGAGIEAGAGKLITWNAGVDWNGLLSPEMRIEVTASEGNAVEGGAMAESSTGLSNRMLVDTLDPFPVIELGPRRTVVTKEDGRSLISYATTSLSLNRPAVGGETFYLEMNLPVFDSEIGGIGAFYGLEVVGNALPTDILKYKVGGEPPSPATPSDAWQPAVFGKIIDIPLVSGTCYFKVDLAPGAALVPLRIQVKFKPVRLCGASGAVVANLDPSRPLWLLGHGRMDSEYSFRRINSAIRKGSGDLQVLSVDWASGADGPGLDGGRYFISLGKSLAECLKGKGYILPDDVHWVGHSWGTLVGYETARAFGGVDRFVALDPARLALGGYNDGRVNFSAISRSATGVKGGTVASGFFGSETKTQTCDFAIRLVSNKHSGENIDDFFYHSLPRHWFLRCMNQSSDPYWPFFKARLLRSSGKPGIPWGAYRKIDGFDLECHGVTAFYDQDDSLPDQSLFIKHQFLLYEKPPLGREMEIRLFRNPDGIIIWKRQPR